MCCELGTLHAAPTSAPSEEEPHIECPDHYQNLQAAMGLADNYWKYYEIYMSPLPFLLPAGPSAAGKKRF